MFTNSIIGKHPLILLVYLSDIPQKVYSPNEQIIRLRHVLGQVQKQVAAKSEARAGLVRDFVSPTFSRVDVERALDSIADANNYIAFNVAPVER